MPNILSLELPGPLFFKSSKIDFSDDAVTYGKKKITYKDVTRISYQAVRTSVNFIPTEQSYNFLIGSETDKISITFSSLLFIGNQKKKDLFGQLITISKAYIEPLLVKSFYEKILSGDSIQISSLNISKNGICWLRFLRRAMCVSWSTYAGTEIVQGSVTLYQKAVNDEPKDFMSIPMSIDNAVILPELLSVCAQELKNT